MSAFHYTTGDKVRQPQWRTGEHVTITAVGRVGFLAEDSWGLEIYYRQQGVTWLRYGTVAA